MVKYELLIEDEAGDQIQFEYNPETDPKNMWVSVRDIDGIISVPVCISLKDSMDLREFMVLVRGAIMEEAANG